MSSDYVIRRPSVILWLYWEGHSADSLRREISVDVRQTVVELLATLDPVPVDCVFNDGRLPNSFKAHVVARVLFDLAESSAFEAQRTVLAIANKLKPRLSELKIDVGSVEFDEDR